AATGAGTASITISGGDSANYTFDITDTGTLTINKKELTATVGDYSKTYGEDNPAFTVEVTGFVNGDTADTASGYRTPAAVTAATTETDAGTLSITIEDDGTADNYTFNNTDTGILTIHKKQLIATATADSKTYDGTTDGNGTINLDGVVGLDDVSASGTFEFEDADAGTGKSVNVTDITLEGTKSGNYILQNTTATAAANIVPAASYMAEAAVNTLIPQAGDENIITLTVKNSSGETDITFGGNTSVMITGYEAAPDGTYGKIGEQNLEEDSTHSTVTFTNGTGSIGLVLNKADGQGITFNIQGLNTQQTNTLTIIPTPRTAAAIEIIQDVEAPSENGGRFAQQP
ncbi:MAG: YDG domain-containing protein, partial [Clostridia bacterium]|nr:YDG domain-containing protein [Clostridia bacterium]